MNADVPEVTQGQAEFFFSQNKFSCFLFFLFAQDQFFLIDLAHEQLGDSLCINLNSLKICSFVLGANAF